MKLMKKALMSYESIDQGLMHKFNQKENVLIKTIHNRETFLLMPKEL